MAGVESILEGLNPEQREAVRHGDGALLVLAGAGSGKTRMLTHRIAHLIASERAQPRDILAVTFTNKAAREMRERVSRLLGERPGVWVSTFHSTCVRILRRDIGHIGYERGFVIYDQADSLAAVKRVLRALGLDEKSHPPRAVRSEIDRLKNRGLLPADLTAADALHDRRLAEVYQRYQTELRRANALDFGDLLVLTTRLFENHPGVLAAYQKRWRYVLVDEYQDTNPVQYKLLRQLCAEHGNLCVVGDEDQSIYRFREADIRNILDFEKDFPGAAVVRLERNYRSTQTILDAAIAVVENNLERKGKKLYAETSGGDPIRMYQASDERAEAAYVVGEALRLREAGASLAEIAVFYRTHAQSRPFEEELLKYDVPYVVVGGTRFYERAEVKDALAYLRVVRNPEDTESLLRVINRPARGIGRNTVERLLALAGERDVTLHGALRIALDEGSLRTAATRRIDEFLVLLDDLRAESDTPALAELVSRVLERTGYVRALEADGSIEAEARLENLAELVSAVAEFERLNRGEGVDDALELDEPDGGAADRDLLDLFLESVTLLSEADDVDASSDRLPLMTAHVAKGLEFDNVFVVGLEEGLLPHAASLSDPGQLEEERRLCYVSMTRARRRLYLTNATMRRMHGSVRMNPPSRFLEETRLALPARPAAFRGGALAPAARPSPAPAGPVIDYSESQLPPGDLPPLETGDRVQHPTFGSGTIVEVSGSGRNGKLKIRFDRAGMKTIVTRFARLRPMSG